jgi:hypothetical protein
MLMAVPHTMTPIMRSCLRRFLLEVRAMCLRWKHKLEGVPESIPETEASNIIAVLAEAAWPVLLSHPAFLSKP